MDILFGYKISHDITAVKINLNKEVVNMEFKRKVAPAVPEPKLQKQLEKFMNK